jgi:hypothetical protein
MVTQLLTILMMKTASVCVALLAIGLLGCNPMQSQVRDVVAREAAFAENTIAISEIPQQPVQGTAVLLQGKVGQYAPLLGGVVYELRDPTGSIWVLNQGPAPEQGNEVLIRGVLRYQSIPINQKEQGAVYVEQQELLKQKT